MDGLQRSTTSFRRQGSSGLVWDDKFLSGELHRKKPKNQDHHKGSTAVTMQRSRSDGGGQSYQTMKASSPTVDPPPPKVSGCGFCGIFGKSSASHQRKSNNRNS